jgi:hypothetical protein
MQLLAQICRLVFQWSIQGDEILSPIAHFAALWEKHLASGGQLLVRQVTGEAAYQDFACPVTAASSTGRCNTI